MLSTGWSDPSSRWLLLAADGTVPIEVQEPHETVQMLRRLPAGTPVAIAGRRGLHAVARQADIEAGLSYLALPATRTPVAITRSRVGLTWVARSVLTVPPGGSRVHLLATAATWLARRHPPLLRLLGGRVLMGVRR
ncbi:MAG TPA: hypothetical protein VGH11_04675 [Jatrophihabitans sp.]|jgi:hypothetical protein